MSRDFNDSNSDFLSRSGAVLTAVPVSMFCWFNADDAINADHLMSLGISGSDFNNFRLMLTNPGGNARAESRDGSTTLDVTTSTAHTTGAWENACAVFDTSFQAAYLNGGGKGSTNSVKTPSGVNYTRFSGATDASGNHFDGRMAHFAIWAAKLTDDEVASLGVHRISPLKVRPSSLVAYYPFLGRDATEIDIIGGNSLTVTGTTVSASDPPVLWLPGRIKYFIPAAGATPAFSSGPTINSTTTSAYTIGYTPTAACTFYAVAVQVNDIVPSKAQIKAGQDSNGNAAIASVSEAVTGADTTVLGGSLTRPGHDIYCLLNNGGGDSAIATLSKSILSPAAGILYSTIDASAGFTAESLWYGASPALISGDLGACDSTLPPGGETVELTSDGIVHYTPIDSGRRICGRRAWKWSVDAWSDAALVPFYINNQAPNVLDFQLAFPVNTPITPTNIVTASGATDVEGDAMTVTALSAEPTGLATVANVIGGTATTPGQVTTSYNFADITGDSANANCLFTIGQVTIATVVGLDQSTGSNQLTADGFNVVIAYQTSSSVALGIIISQTPAGGTQASYGTTVNLVVSLGPVSATLTQLVAVLYRGHVKQIY